MYNFDIFVLYFYSSSYWRSVYIIAAFFMKRLLPFFVAILLTSTVYGQLPLPNLLAWYPFCGNSNDLSGNGYNLVNTGAAITTDRFTNPNTAYSFNGGTSSMSYGVPFFSASGFTTSDFTYSCWIYPTLVQSAIIWYNGDPTVNGYGVYMNNGTLGTPGTNIEVVFGGGIGQYASTPVTLNAWHHVVLTKSGGGFHFVIDGTDHTFVPVTLFVVPTTGQFTVGQNYTNGLDAFSGSVDDIAIYSFYFSTSSTQLTAINNFDPDVAPFTLGNDTTICSKNITLTPSPSFDTTYKYAWSTGDTTASATVIPLGGTGSNYTLTISKPYGCSASKSINIKHLSVTVNIGPRDTTFCTSGSTILNPSPVSGETFTWSTGETTGSILATGSGTYWVVVDSANGCTGTDTTTIAVQPPVIVNLGRDSSSCAGAPMLLQSSNTYTPPVSYSWGGSPLPGGVLTGATYTASVSGTYWLTVTVGACKGSDTQTVNIVYDTFKLITPDTAICKGSSLQVAAYGNPFASYLWTPTAGISSPLSPNPLITPDTSATYKITAIMFGCYVSDSFHVDVQPKPTVYIGGNRNVCKGDTIHITAIVRPAWYTHYIYSWTPGTNLDHSTTTTTDSALGTVVFTAGDSTDLILVVKTPLDSTGRFCRAVDSAEIMVHTPHPTVLPDLSLCPGDSAILNPNPIVGDSYIWHPGTYLSDSTVVQPVAKPILTQFYWVQSTDKFGCHDTTTENIKVLPGAVIYLGDSVTLYPGETYQISPQTNCVNFAWHPPLGLNDTAISNPIASPVVNTKYIVKATTEWGCYVTDSINIHVDPTSIIDLPNAFTPGTGANNYLYVLKRGIVQLNYFRIFNRWGNKVYETNNIDAGWDGTFHGKPQPFDVYVYDVEAVTNKGVIFHKTGNVTLLR